MYQADLGVSLRPVKRLARKTGRVLKKVAKPALVAVYAPFAVTAWVATKAGKLALKPVRRKIRRLTARRAAKLAMDRRRSTQPNKQELAEARAWTKAKMRGLGLPHGPVLALLAGAPPEMLEAEHMLTGPFGEPVTAATITASIPVLLKLIDVVAARSAKSGEAPATPAAAAVEEALPEEPEPLPPTEEVIETEEAPEVAPATEVYVDEGAPVEGAFGFGMTPRAATVLVFGVSALAIVAGIFYARR